MSASVWLLLGLTCVAACENEDPSGGNETETGDGDGDPGDGDGDPGDGDGDPGDGDGDPGDGDGDPGDGDGDPGDGDGDWEDLCMVAPTVGSTRCGDGLVGLGESCDDGNRDDADACSNACATVHAAVGGFAVAGMTALSLVPGPTPEATRLTLLEPGPGAIVHSYDVNGLALGASDPIGMYGTTLRSLPDGRAVVMGVEHDGEVTSVWTAHLDDGAELLSYELHDPPLGEATASLLVRDDGSAVACAGTQPEFLQLVQNPGVWAIDGADQLSWTAHPFGEDSTLHAPGGAAEREDGTVVAMHRIRGWTDLDELVTRGYGLTGLDPETGAQLWVNEVVCDEPSLSNNVEFVGLANNTFIVATWRSLATEIVIFDADGQMIGRERWPEFEGNNGPVRVIADAEGGAYVLGTLPNGPDDSYVAYWHAEHSRRWVLILDVPGAKLLDGALEPGERLWILGEDGVLAISS